LQKRGNLRNEIIGYYQKWQTEVAQLDNPSQAEKQLVEKQAEVSKALGLWDEIIDGIPSNFFRNANDLGETYDTFNKLSKTVRGEAFNYYKQQKWDKLEQLFKTYKLKWPPADGGYNIIYNVSLKKGMKFDRYGNAIKETLKGETPILAGEFTSPIINGKRYSFSQRALNKLESEYDFYYEIEIIKDVPFSGDSADIIPWFNQIGKGKQMKWNIPINPKTNFPKTWNELVREGYIRVIIKDSPSGKYKYLINKEIK